MAKVVRTDRELELPGVDAALRAAGHELVLLPDGVSQKILLEEAKDASVLLMCYTPITRALIEAAPNFKGIVKYGVGIDAIDIAAARERGVLEGRLVTVRSRDPRLRAQTRGVRFVD